MLPECSVAASQAHSALRSRQRLSEPTVFPLTLCSRQRHTHIVTACLQTPRVHSLERDSPLSHHPTSLFPPGGHGAAHFSRQVCSRCSPRVQAHVYLGPRVTTPRPCGHRGASMVHLPEPSPHPPLKGTTRGARTHPARGSPTRSPERHPAVLAQLLVGPRGGAAPVPPKDAAGSQEAAATHRAPPVGVGPSWLGQQAARWARAVGGCGTAE